MSITAALASTFGSSLLYILHIALYLHNNHCTWIVSCIFQISQFRSSISQQRIVPKIKPNLGNRAFSVAAPRVWNEILITLKTAEDLTRFNKIAISNNKFQMASGQGSHWLIESPTIFSSMCSPPLSDICQFYF